MDLTFIQISLPVKNYNLLNYYYNLHIISFRNVPFDKYLQHHAKFGQNRLINDTLKGEI